MGDQLSIVIHNAGTLAVIVLQLFPPPLLKTIAIPLGQTLDVVHILRIRTHCKSVASLVFNYTGMSPPASILGYLHGGGVIRGCYPRTHPEVLKHPFPLSEPLSHQQVKGLHKFLHLGSGLGKDVHAMKVMLVRMWVIEEGGGGGLQANCGKKEDNNMYHE